MKSILLLVSYLLFSLTGISQTMFQRWYDNLGADYGNMVTQTDDGGFAVLTYTMGSSTYFNTVMRMDSTGNILWIKKIPGAVNVNPYTFIRTSDNAFVLGGSVFFNNSNRGNILKLDGNGNLLWSKIYYSDSATYSQRIFSIKQTSNGSFISACSADSGNGRECFRMMETDSTGSFLWAKDFGVYSKIEPNDIAVCQGEGYIMTGTYQFDGGATLIKTDSNGNPVWAKVYDVSTDVYVRGYRVIQTPDNGFIGLGYDYDGRNKIFLFKVTNSGNLLWARRLWINEWSIASDISKTIDGGCIICATAWNSTNTGKNVYVIKFDVNGNITWSITLGNDLEEGRGIFQNTDGSYVISGFTDGFGAVSSNIYLVKTDANGNSGCFQNNVSTKDSNITALITVTNLTGTHSWPTAMTDTVPAIDNYSVLNYTICTNVGIEKINDWENDFSLSPNPAISSFTISDLRSTISNIEMYNVLGEKVFSQPVTSNQKQVTVNIADFSPGVYFVRLQNEDYVTTHKVVIQH